MELLKSAEEKRYASVSVDHSSEVRVVEVPERDAGIPVPGRERVHTSAQPGS